MSQRLAKRWPVALELVAELVVVVELAVLDRPDRAVLVRERLVAALDVDDAQPPDAERDAGRRVRAAVVRAAVRHRVGHPVEDVGRDDPSRLAPDLDDSADPAHAWTVSGQPSRRDETFGQTHRAGLIVWLALSYESDLMDGESPSEAGYGELMSTSVTRLPSPTARIARTPAEMQSLRQAWTEFAWPRVDADLEFLATLIETLPVGTRPHVAVIDRDGEPTAMLVGRIEDTRLAVAFGYRIVFRPWVRILTVAHGGFGGGESEPAAIMDEVLRLLRDGEADVALLPGLREGSSLLVEARSRPQFFARDRGLSLRMHRRLDLPGTYEEFLRSRSKSTRESIKRYSRKLERDLGQKLRMRVFSETRDIDEMFAATETVAAKTYQRGLGVALADNDQARRLVRLGLERGWFRTWVLYVDEEPVAFWPGWTYGGTFYVGTPGYDPALAEYRLVPTS